LLVSNLTRLAKIGKYRAFLFEQRRESARDFCFI
jgi:hypothetical protein